MNSQYLKEQIQQASTVIGKTWPLYSFVTSNPLSGYENIPFEKATDQAKGVLNAKVFPDASVYRQAWERGAIKSREIEVLLKEHGFQNTPEFYLELLESQVKQENGNPQHELDSILVKWLSAFMDEGLAEWELPYKEKGFYQAWRQLAPFDSQLNINEGTALPTTALEALEIALHTVTQEEYAEIFKYHLAALPGWTGFINYRMDSASSWQQQYPITLEDYLAVRLWIAHHLQLTITPEAKTSQKNDTLEKLQYLWLQAWERSWQHELVGTLEKESISLPKTETAPEAQLVFCIDTRSELIRRHVESQGNYETFGYAGFFGIAMDYTDLENGITRKSCPPIVSSAYNVTESPQTQKEDELADFQKRNQQEKFGEYFLKRMKNMLPSAFGFVEGSGILYGCSILARTLFPACTYRFASKNKSSHEHICDPQLHASKMGNEQELGISLPEKVAIVKSAFALTGWKNFSPLVLFVGHGSHSANNPFGSSLDCGACAASPGRHNARMLAKLANLPEVRNMLAKEHHIEIPDTTLFLGAEHNTTTDEIVMFDSDIPDSHRSELLQLKSNLAQAQQTATQERLGTAGKSIALAQQKANNWGETRPEWGLAKNAGFIIAPRSLTQNKNLDGRCFLHSYDWELDPSGEALQGILQGPMVVTQWINNHYYFSTVDNDRFGGGSKITHNITGKFGVVQGNGGDLKMGLPLQSLNASDTEMYHQPLRLSVLVQAPVERVNEILSKNENLKSLLDNEWIYLLVMDPLQGNKTLKYHKGLQWTGTSQKSSKTNFKASKTVSPIMEAMLSE